MSIIRRVSIVSLKLAVRAALSIGLLSGAALGQVAAIPVNTSVTMPTGAASISRENALAILKNAAGELVLPPSTKFAISGIEITDDQVLVFIGDNGDRSHTLAVSSLAVHVTIGFLGAVHCYFTADDKVFLFRITPDLAIKVGQALEAIKAAPSPKEQQEQQIAFEAQAKSYRDAPVKPVPGEDVRRYLVQVDVAVNEKRFQDAADLYARALYIAPWWPDGHFNAALILGGLRQYDKAIDDMQKYLLLVPNAQDARAAQDKIYAWEGQRAAR
jgi:tetratricopeptide (TPR) repeat protein